MAMKTKNDIVLPISFPVDTSGYSSSLQTMESMNRAFMGSLKSNRSPLFPDQSTELNKFKSSMLAAKTAIDRVAVAMGNTNNSIALSGKALHDHLMSTLRASRQLAKQISAEYARIDASVLTSVKAQIKAKRELTARQLGSSKATHKAKQLVHETKVLNVENEAALRIRTNIATQAAQHRASIESKAALNAANVAVAAANKSATIKLESANKSAKVKINAERKARAEEGARRYAGKTYSGALQPNPRPRGLGDTHTTVIDKTRRLVREALDKQTAATKRLIAAEKQQLGVVGKVATATNKTTTANKKLSASTSFLTNRLSKAAKFFAIIEGPLGPHAGRLTAMASAVRNMGVLALGAGLLVGGLGMAMRRAIPAAIDLQRTMSTLSAATGDAKKSFAFVLSESRRTGAELGGLAASYAQLSAAAKGTILQGEGINKVFHAINTASSALRLDINQTKGTIKALEQMMSKGTVSSEEMRQQLGERLPGAFRLAADAMDMTTQQFSKNLALGKIMATDMLPKLAKAMERAYGSSALSAQKTLGVALQQLNVEVTNFYQHLVNPEALDSFSSAINSITSSVRSLSDWLTPVPGHINKTSFAIKAFVTLLQTAVVGAAGLLLKKLVLLTWEYKAQLSLIGRFPAAMTLMSVAFTSPIKSIKVLIAIIRTGLIPSIVAMGAALGKITKKNPWLLAIGTAMTAYAGLSLWLDVQASKDEAKAKLRADKTTAGIRKRLAQQLALVKSSRIALAKANATPIDTGFWADNIAKQQAHKRAAQITYDAAVAGVKHERALLDAAVRADEVTIQALTSRSTATQKMMNHFQKIIDNKTTTPIERALGSAKAALAAEIMARHAFNKKAVNLKHDLTKAEIHEARLQRKTHEGSIAVFKKQILSLTALREKEIKKSTHTARKEARTAKRIAKAQAHATAQALIATAHAKAIIGMKEGSDKAIRAQQSLDIEVAFNAYILASATETSLAKRELLKAEFDNTKAMITKQANLTLGRKDVPSSPSRGGTDATTNLNNKRAALQLSESKLSGVSNQFATLKPIVLDKGKSKAIDDALQAKKDELTAKLALRVEHMAAGDALDIVMADHAKNIRSAEIEATLAHNENLLSIQKQHYDNITGLRNSFSELASSDQQTNLGGLLSGMMSFNTEIGNIQQLGNDLEKAKKEGSTADITKLEKQKNDATMSLTKGALGAISGLMSSHNKKAFMVGKAAAVANAVINTYEGASAALKLGPPGIPMAAVIVAAGLMNVQKIMATKMGGSSAPTASTPASTVGQYGGRVGIMPVSPFNAGRPQQTTTPSVSIVQNITAPNATAGTASSIQLAAKLGAQQAVQAVGVDFANNGPLRQTLAV